MSESGDRTEAQREGERRAREEARARREQRLTPPPGPPVEPMDPVPPAASGPLNPLNPPNRSLEPRFKLRGPQKAARPTSSQPARVARTTRASRVDRASRLANSPRTPLTGHAAATPRAVGAGAGRGRYGRRRVLGAVVGSVFLVIIAVVAWFLISLFQPFTGAGRGTVEVTIPPEDSTAQVGTILADKKVISSAFFFRVRVELGGDHLRSGQYTLKYGMSYGAALAVLKKAPALAPTVNVTIVPGKSRFQIGQLLAKEGVRDSYRVESRTSPLLDPASYGAPRGTGSLEGFLYPDTYNLKRPITIKALVADQLTEFKKQFATVNFAYAKSKNLTPYDVLTIASLEDAEAALPGDLPKVASVIYNRLHDDMTLGLDTTAAFAANNYSGNLTQAQLNSRSPWNTLVHRGLPPTPIDSPDLAAINAAAHPAHTNDLYFIVKVCGNGALAFTNNYQQFLGLSSAYSASLAKRGAEKTEFCAKKK